MAKKGAGCVIKIHIQDIPSSNNKYQGQGSKSKAIRDYQHEKKLWNQYIWIMRRKLQADGELKGMEKPLQEATVIIFYHFRTRSRRDPDNYSGKMILDGLKDNGFISDDSFKEIDIFPLADFGRVNNDSVEIFILPGKQLEEIVRKLIERGLKE
jgi:crossover junction endodeoxyribonuclease RusA